MVQLTANTHLVDDLCFGPLWPLLCQRLGALLPHAVAGGWPQAAHLLRVVLDTAGRSSPVHAAELLEVVLPSLAQARIRLPLPAVPQGGSLRSNAPPSLPHPRYPLT